MITIKDIAERSGYSIGTVSRVINNRADVSDKAREKIEEIIQECNYEPNSNARMLKQNMSSEISVIVRGNRNVFFEYILEEIQIRMREHGESINVQFVRETDNAVETAIQIGQKLKPKGIMFLGGSYRNFREHFSMIKIPSVLVSASAEGLGFDNLSSFTTDYEGAAGYAVSKLTEQGHRRIGILGGYPGDPKIGGAVKELERNGIAFDFDRDYEPCAFSPEDGYRAGEKLLSRSPDLTAVFGLSDSIAIGAMRAFADRKLRIPEDISVIGFDGINAAEYSIPRLATIRQETTMLARRSVDDLLIRISYKSPAVHELIPYEYVKGESIAPPSK